MTADWINGARGLLDQATPGPWATERDGVYTADRSYLIVPLGDSVQDYTDGEFIAEAPTIVARAIALIDRIEKAASRPGNLHEVGKRPDPKLNAGYDAAMHTIRRILDGEQ